MKSRAAKGVLHEYGQVGAYSGVEDAEPHQLIQLLLDSALDKIRLAKGQIIHRQVAQKGENISAAISIVEGLRASLDIKNSGQIAENLEKLYDYMERRLLEANVKNDPDILTEVAGLLGQIREAWAAIKSQVRQPEIAREAV